MSYINSDEEIISFKESWYSTFINFNDKSTDSINKSIKLEVDNRKKVLNTKASANQMLLLTNNNIKKSNIETIDAKNSIANTSNST